MYLGSKIRKFKMPNGVEAWVQSASKYIQEACKNVRQHIRVYLRVHRHHFQEITFPNWTQLKSWVGRMENTFNH
jgi:hypothetical protein